MTGRWLTVVRPHVRPVRGRSPSRVRSAARSLAVCAVAFFFGTFAFAEWADHSDEFRDRAYGEKYRKLKALHESKAGPLFVAFGSSRL